MAFTLPAPEGTRRWFEATGQPVAAAGPHLGSVVVIRDITDRSLRRLQEEFLALASHELRTPLTPIRGYIQMLNRLLDTAETDERARRYLTQLDEQAQRLQRLVDDLLDVGRLREGKLNLSLAPVDLVALVGGLVEALHGVDGGPLVQFDSTAEALVVSGDATRLEQIVLNLLTNAIKYAPASPRIDVRLRREDTMALLEVQDYGPGIAPDAIPQLFQRFYQAAGRGGQQGLGIGLFVARELARAHGGEVEVRSVEGEGATFTVRLPLQEP